MDIKTTLQPDGYWVAIDADTYDVDCDQDGFFSNSPAGYGKTEKEAIEELIADIEDRARALPSKPWPQDAIDQEMIERTDDGWSHPPAEQDK